VAIYLPRGDVGRGHTQGQSPARAWRADRGAGRGRAFPPTALEPDGLENARRLDLKVNVDREPTDEELKVPLASRGVVRIELD
jgi:hypothetical protein